MERWSSLEVRICGWETFDETTTFSVSTWKSMSVLEMVPGSATEILPALAQYHPLLVVQLPQGQWRGYMSR